MSRYLDKVAKSMEGNAPFRAEAGLEEGRPEAAEVARQLPAYVGWLESQKRALESDEDQRLALDHDIPRNLAFHGYTQDLRRDAVFFEQNDLGVHLREDVNHQALHRLYGRWITETLEEIHHAQSEQRVKRVLGQEERERLERQLAEARGTIREARQRELTFQQAKLDKTAMKQRAVDFLKARKKWHVYNRRVTATLVSKLNDVLTDLDERRVACQRSQAEIRVKRDRLRREQEAAEDPNAARRLGRQADAEQAKLARGWTELEGLADQWRDAANLIEGLAERQQAKADAKERSEAGRSGAKSLVDRTGREVSAHRHNLLEQRGRNYGQVGDGSLLATEKSDIESRHDRLAALIERVPVVHRDLERWLTRQRETRLAVAQGEALEERLLVRDSGNMLEINRRYLAKDREALRRIDEEVARHQRIVTSTMEDHDRAVEALVFANEEHAAKVGAIAEETNATVDLSLDKAAVRRELRKLERLPANAKALNVYCTWYDASFDTFLALGRLVGGKPPQSRVGRAASKLLISAPVQGKAYDCGSMGLSLKLGLSYGVGEAAKIGLALVYDTGLNVQDDRRFRSVATWSVKASASVEVPKIYKNTLEATLFRDKTVFVFQDVYHWAAWVAQRWARSAAIVRACDRYVFEGNGTYDKQPTADELTELLDLANVLLQEDQHLSQVYREIIEYTRLNVVRVEERAFFESAKASFELAGGFASLAAEVSRTQHPRFVRYKMKTVDGQSVVDTDRAGYPRIEERSARVTPVSLSFGLAGLSFALTQTNIEDHANPDNDGLYMNLKIGLPGLSDLTFGLAEPPEAIATPDFFLAKWGEELAPTSERWGDALGWLQGASGELNKGALKSLSTKFKIAEFELNWLRSEVGRESKWVLQYWRCISSRSNAVEVSVPTSVPGLNIDMGAELSYSRCYWEHPGSNTLSYFQTIYDGYMNVPAMEAQIRDKRSTARPEEATGEALWQRYLEDKSDHVLQVFMNIASDQWVKKEIDTSIAAGRNLASSGLSRGFGAAKERLTRYFEAVRLKTNAEQASKWRAARTDSPADRVVKVIEPRDWLRVITQAQSLADRSGKSREACVRALRENGYNSERALAALTESRRGGLFGRGRH